MEEGRNLDFTQGNTLSKSSNLLIKASATGSVQIIRKRPKTFIANFTLFI